MGFVYAVVGAGRQGTAAAYDLAIHGDADAILLADANLARARAAARRVNALARTDVARGARVDVTKGASFQRAVTGSDVIVSAVPYRYNLGLTRGAIAVKASMVDLGGNTAIVRRQLALDRSARRASVAIVPDCGMGPGANVSLAIHAMGLLDEPREVRVYDGGLPADPKPPWNYALTFNVQGLTNEYTGSAVFLRGGKVAEVPALTEPEEVDVPALGRLEALVTSGGLSTMPWTFEGRLQILENKTLRYPGHWAQIRGFADLGLFATKPIRVNETKIVPRDLFHALFEPQVTPREIRDVAVIHIVARGVKDGAPAEATVDLVDRFDPRTGFRAMERVTGWHAAIVAEMIAREEIPPGAHSVESGVPATRFVKEARARGIEITENVRGISAYGER